ncbi:hypothetical protein SAMN04488028_10974 [Reichenbachiella agariperforans]|uniref:Uncharacterized protein n=1 Tax=Reichenbachiella agariperforans TaxID=156994 RepID=A0A1M6VJJ4_REIAG|nr:hypothetical protein [Reichenbachiella agariperforans]SHK81535.1 hypothetical protein SAMN04488028_10974 [Reichenbachiella agariperforans]
MKRNIKIISIIVFFLIGSNYLLRAQDNTRIGQVSFIPGFSTSIGSSERTNIISLNILGGYQYALKGAEIGSLFNLNRQNASGAQLAGLLNYTGGQTIGAQVSGLINLNRNHIQGLQLAGMINTVQGSVTGVQIGGLLNYSTEVVQGVQVAGLSNLSQETIGMQLSGLHNHSLRTKGLQLAGLSNQSTLLQGTQISAIANVSEQNQGLQLSGIYNQTSELNGIQIGLVNIADSVSSGMQVGLINIVKKNGLFELGVEYGDVTPWNLNLRTGRDHFYSILTVGTQFEQSNEDKIWSYGIGFGSKMYIKDKLFANVELSTHQLRKHQVNVESLNLLNRFQINMGYQLFKHLSVTAGPVLNIYVAQTDLTPSDQPTIDIAKSPFYEEQEGNYKIQAWVGYSVGIRF